MAFKLALSLLPFASVALSQTVTIDRSIPSSDHRCIKNCLDHPFGIGSDIGKVLECAKPYEEDCYCPTEDAQAEIVSRHIDACATSSCSRGDVTQDIDKMRAHYATYCVQKGYTASIVEGWYSALETVVSTTSGEGTTTTTTTAATSSAEESETDDTAPSTSAPASTSGPTSTVATTTTTTGGDPAATTTGEGGLRVPDLDDGAMGTRPGLLVMGAIPLVALGQLL